MPTAPAIGEGESREFGTLGSDLGKEMSIFVDSLSPSGSTDDAYLIALLICAIITLLITAILLFCCVAHCLQHRKYTAMTPTTRDSRTNVFQAHKTKLSDSNCDPKLPQIRISISSASVDRPLSRMSGASILPPWMENTRCSYGNTPQTPSTPASVSSPLQDNVLTFWQRLSGKSSEGSLENGGGPNSFGINMDDGGRVDDYEIDSRSVLHYELGFYGKTVTSCFRGTLTFQLRYDFIHRVLMLHVIRANHLPQGDGPPDPYIKMYCLPERRNHCKTRILKKSCDPDFNEMFSFDVAYNQLPNRMLQFTVYDFDRFTRHGLVGNVIMRDLFDKSDLFHWTEYTMQVVGNQDKNDYGDLLLYLSYSADQRKLHIIVAKAYNLRPMDITGASDPYVKIEQVYQRRRVKCKKTSTKRANLNPVYHETLEFDLAPEQVDETNMLVQVMDWDRIGRDDLLGCCILGKESPTKEGRQQWEQAFSTLKIASKTSTGDAAHVPSASPVENNNDEERVPTLTDPSVPHAVGTWHSILGDVPEGFRNIPKAKK
ncbi:Protein SNT-5 [Aphelenchoides avenae]|nr:Protein SNT-5 [Aphelenchus avenae]